jgi:tetratricopeptide (TPR) repeat protein
MDGRGALRLSVCLLFTAVGCQHEVMTLPSSPPTSAGNPSPLPHPSQVKQAPTKLKGSAKPKELPPLVLVSYGNYEVGEAFAARTGPERQQQLCESARMDYERALKIDPKCIPAYQGLARLYKAMHELPLAIETYQNALKLAPDNASLWFELGLCHNSQKNWGAALECLERAARIDPGNRSYANALGVVLAEAGRYEESLKCFIRSNGEAMGYYRLAQTLRHLQQPELSRRCLEVAVQKDPSLAPPIQQTAYERDAESTPEVSHSQTARKKLSPSSRSPAAAADQLLPQILLPPMPLIHGEDEQPNP